jgi:TonB family protein
MSDSRPCVRCSRPIDAWAGTCPYCNWDQTRPAPAQEPPKPSAVTDYRPPSEHNLRKKAMFAGGGALVLVASFAIGMVINSDDTPKAAPKTVEEQMAEDQAQRAIPAARRADTPLVPMNQAGGIEQPITSAPVDVPPGGMPNDAQRTDATAVSATEYAELAKRAKAEKDRMAAVVDPRSLTGPAYVPPARPRNMTTPRQIAQQVPQPSGTLPSQPAFGAPPDAPRPPPQQQQEQPRQQRQAVLRTRPVPQYQPIPSIRARGTAKLSLMVGTDGRVKQVNIERPLQGNTAALLAAVQSWRFKPATENGQPVAAPYNVEISFKQ